LQQLTLAVMMGPIEQQYVLYTLYSSQIACLQMPALLLMLRCKLAAAQFISNLLPRLDVVEGD